MELKYSVFIGNAINKDRSPHYVFYDFSSPVGMRQGKLFGLYFHENDWYNEIEDIVNNLSGVRIVLDMYYDN